MAANSDGGWNIDTLHAHLKSLIDTNESRAIERQAFNDKALTAALAAAKELVSTAQTAADRAVQKAEVASEKRFEAVNEFRAAMDDQQRRLMPRQEVEVLLKALNDRIDVISEALTQLGSQRIGVKEGWGWAVGIIGLVLALIGGIAAFWR